MSTYTIGIGNAVRDAGASLTAFPDWRGCESIINLFTTKAFDFCSKTHTFTVSGAWERVKLTVQVEKYYQTPRLNPILSTKFGHKKHERLLCFFRIR
jgi:hypothetical protein